MTKGPKLQETGRRQRTTIFDMDVTVVEVVVDNPG